MLFVQHKWWRQPNTSRLALGETAMETTQHIQVGTGCDGDSPTHPGWHWVRQWWGQHNISSLALDETVLYCLDFTKEGLHTFLDLILLPNSIVSQWQETHCTRQYTNIVYFQNFFNYYLLVDNWHKGSNFSRWFGSSLCIDFYHVQKYCPENKAKYSVYDCLENQTPNKS